MVISTGIIEKQCSILTVIWECNQTNLRNVSHIFHPQSHVLPNGRNTKGDVLQNSPTSSFRAIRPQCSLLVSLFPAVEKWITTF